MIERSAEFNFHGKILRLMKALGYEEDQEGMCFGIALMGIQAMLINDMEPFQERLDFIKKVSVQEISEFSKKHKKDGENKKTFSESEKKILDLLYFFDGIAIHHSPEKYSELFENDNVPQSQNAQASFPLTLSKDLEDAGGALKLFNFSGYYTPDSLENYFSTLKKSITPNSPTITLSLGNLFHRISVGYNGTHWILIDANQLPPLYITSDKDIAKKVMEGFEENDITMIHTEVYVAKNNSNKTLEKAINKWGSKIKNDLDDRVLETLFSAFSSGEKNILEITLNSAVIADKKDLIDYILKQKIDPNFEVNGESILQVAVDYENQEVVERILSYDSLTQKTINTALKQAILNDNVSIVAIFLKHNDSLIDAVYDHDNLAHLAAKNNSSQCLELLLNKKESFLNSKSNEPDNAFLGNTLLISAAANGDSQSIRVLLSKQNCSINEQNNSGLTALHYTVLSGSPDAINVLSSLLRAGVDANIQNNAGETPLILAARENNLDAVKALLSAKNIKINTKDANKNTALDYAKELGHDDIVSLILAKKEQRQKTKEKTKNEGESRPKPIVSTTIRHPKKNDPEHHQKNSKKNLKR